MIREELICAVVEAFELKGIVQEKHFYQSGRAVQVCTYDGSCFNIVAIKIQMGNSIEYIGLSVRKKI